MTHIRSPLLEEMELTGIHRCFKNNLPSAIALGIPGVGVYKANKGEDNIVKTWILVGQSSYDKISIENSGYFDIQFNIETQESLFFSLPYFYLEEFKLGELLNNKVSLLVEVNPNCQINS